MNHALRQSVDDLLAHYQAYRQLQSQKDILGQSLARAKLHQTASAADQQRYLQLDAKLQELSDAMTFDTPFIWILYKYEAYAAEAQPIVTMADFRLHCAKPDYICTKRYTFLNDQLQATGRARLDDRGRYPDELPLDQLLEAPELQALVQDPAVQIAWRASEYYTDEQGAVAKWQNISHML